MQNMLMTEHLVQVLVRKGSPDGRM